MSLTAILTLALGIGANSATAGFAKSLLLYEPAVTAPEELVRLFIGWGEGSPFGGWSYPDYADFRDRNDVFVGLVAEGVRPLHLSHDGDNIRIWGSIVSADYFSMLGVEPALGRGFLPEEDATRGTHPVVVLGHALWRSSFGADPGVLGKQILLNGHPFTVVGVGPEGFVGTNVGVNPELWVPLMMLDVLVPAQNMLDARSFQGIPFVIGRLRPGVGIEQAGQASARLIEQIAEENPNASQGKRVRILRESEAGLHPLVRRPMVGFFGLTFGVVGLILLLTCANVAGLQLARSLSRSREIGVRLALGASRLRLVRQLMTESLILSLLAGGAGLILARYIIALVKALRPTSALPIDWTVRIDAGVLTFTFVAAALTAILSGLAPALHAARWDCMSVLRGGLVFPSGKASRARKGLVVCQLALSLTLLIGAGLAVRSLANVMSLDLGFDPHDVLVTSIDLELQGYGPQEAVQLQRELKERVGALPGVEGVALAQRVPLDLRVSRLGVVPEGFELPKGSPRPVVDYNVIDSDYFDLLRIKPLRGRGFNEADDENAPAAMVINETFAERFWPEQDPLGKRVLTLGGEHTVVGIVSDGKYETIGEDPLPYIYLSLHQSHRGAVVLHVRSPAGSSSLAAAVRAEMVALDETLPVDDLRAMRSAMGFALLPARIAAGLVTALAAVSLLLASIGLFAVISSAVNQGLHDIGVRVALGASPADVVTLILRQGVFLTATGIVFGLIGGFALARVMAALLFEVSATDMFAYVPAAAILTGVALLASFGPARRAARADTLAALKAE